MPGLFGIIGNGPLPERKAALELMAKSMKHEPFYTSGMFCEERAGLGVGWVCHPGSFADCQPIWNQAKDLCLVFSGEHFGDKSELEQLRAGGHEVVGENAAYLVHLYETCRDGFFEKLNGAFSGLLVDLRERKAVLFNDRYGLNRIYFHEAKGGFYFASEAKALLKVLPQLRQLDWRSWGEFFSCGCALQNRSLFAGISLLPGGARWTFRRQEPAQRESYFRREVWEKQGTLPAAEYYQQLKEGFASVLPRYFRGNGEVALSLTGGLDSRLIAAWAPRSPYKLQCYTFGGLYRPCADVTIARRVAKACQQYHEVVSLNRKFFTEFPALAKRSVYFTDGALDVSGSVELFVNRMARELSPIRLTGNYGDEVLRGYIPFKVRPLDESVLSADFLRSVRDAIGTYHTERQVPRLSFVAFKQVPWHHYGRRAAEQSQLTTRTPYLDNDLVRLVYQAPPGLSDSVELALGLIAEGHPILRGLATDRGHIGPHRRVTGQVRQWFQLLTNRAEYVYDYGMPQWLAALDGRLKKLRLERLFLGRHKFYHFRIWYRDELAPYVKDVLLDGRTLGRPYLNGRCVEQIVSAHIQARGNYTQEIHQLLTSELIQRNLIEK